MSDGTCEHGAEAGSYWQPPEDCRRCSIWEDTMWHYTSSNDSFPDALAEAVQSWHNARALQVSAPVEQEYVLLGQEASDIAVECEMLRQDMRDAPRLPSGALLALRVREAAEVVL